MENSAMGDDALEGDALEGDALASPSLSDWLIQARRRLSEAGIESAPLEAQVLAAHALGVDRAWVLAHPSFLLLQKSALDELLSRRLRFEPLAYILGYREFYGRRFTVDPAVLIPRQETETLVLAALARIPQDRPAHVLDIGTGSGAIAITLALERPNIKVTATDLSEAALSVARANAQTLGAAVEFHLADLFPPSIGRFDLIVSNPPYVAVGDEVGADVHYEPPAALYAGTDGMDIFRGLAADAQGHLVKGGALLLEVGAGQATAVRALFEDSGWRWDGTIRDLAGIERVVVLIN